MLANEWKNKLFLRKAPLRGELDCEARLRGAVLDWQQDKPENPLSTLCKLTRCAGLIREKPQEGGFSPLLRKRRTSQSA